MPATIERTISIDRLLAKQAEDKLRNYGWSIERAVDRMLVAITTIQGEPENAFASPQTRTLRRQPGALSGQIHIAPDFDASSSEISDLFENSIWKIDA